MVEPELCEGGGCEGSPGKLKGISEPPTIGSEPTGWMGKGRIADRAEGDSHCSGGTGVAACCDMLRWYAEADAIVDGQER